MLKMDIVDLENNTISTRFGSDKDLLAVVELDYPPAYGAVDLKAAIAALNASDLYQAKVEPWYPRPEPLNRGYLTEGPQDDPWPRHG